MTTETLRNPFVSTDTLPAYIRNFVLLNNELKGLKVGLIHAVTNPDKIAEEEKAKDVMAEAWKRYYDGLQDWMKNLFARFYAFYDGRIDYLSTLESELNKEIENLKDKDPALAHELEHIKDEVVDLKEEAKSRKQSFADRADEDEPIDEDEFDNMYEEAENHTRRTRSAASRFYQRMRNFYRNRWGRNRANEADTSMGTAPGNASNNFNDDDSSDDEGFDLDGLNNIDLGPEPEPA
ncbi:MAG: hypothetical protein KDJ35_03225 [Alphaproteobacteria bacterium]|nr:hypothetical protein [Alphaproteobacteria bacterium]